MTVFLGHYIHFEASLGELDSTGIVYSGVVDWNESVNCLGFWYNMYGEDIGLLRVFTASADNYTVDVTPLWSRDIENDRDWHYEKGEFNASAAIRVSTVFFWLFFFFFLLAVPLRSWTTLGVVVPQWYKTCSCYVR